MHLTPTAPRQALAHALREYRATVHSLAVSQYPPQSIGHAPQAPQAAQDNADGELAGRLSETV